MKFSTLISLVFLFFLAGSAFAEEVQSNQRSAESAKANQQPVQGAPEAKSATPKPNQAPPPKVGSSKRIGWLSSIEFWLSISVLVFGLIFLMIGRSVIQSTGFSPDDVNKLLAVTLIVIATLFIITAGYDSEQIAPAMGLFGTVAGYLLGKTSQAKEKQE